MKDKYAPTIELKPLWKVLFQKHQRGSLYFNPWPHPKMTQNLLKWWKEHWKNRHHLRSCTFPPLIEDGWKHFEALESPFKLIWGGHATFGIQMSGQRILIDPIQGRAGLWHSRLQASPLPWEELGTIDLILISHGHWDHLDTPTLRALALKHPNTVVLHPLGLQKYLPKGLKPIAMDWWDRFWFGDLEIIFVPAQHWHMRTPWDRNRALWGGWLIKNLDQTLYFSGDTGYFEGFSYLGEAFEIDIALLPGGAYEPSWFMNAQHMNAEQVARAFLELKAKTLIPFHWGTYILSDECPYEGIQALQREVQKLNLLDALKILNPGDSFGR